jgi:hypothetical protein
VACGAAPIPVALAPAPKSMAHLTFYVLEHAQLSGDMAGEHAALQESLPDAVSSALTRAGFQVVTDKAQRHDAVVKVRAPHKTSRRSPRQPRADAAADHRPQRGRRRRLRGGLVQDQEVIGSGRLGTSNQELRSSAGVDPARTRQ